MRIQAIAIIKRRRRRNQGRWSEKSYNSGFHCWYRRRSGEWSARECHKTRPGIWPVNKNFSIHSSQGSGALKEVGQAGDQNGLLWDEERASQDVGGVVAYVALTPRFMTILDHLRQHSLCWWVSWDGVKASWPASPSPRRPPRMSRRGCVNGVAADFA